MVVSEYQPTAEENLFLSYYDALIRETIYARSHFKIWELMIDSIKEYSHEFNNAPHFFRFTIKSHLDDVILTLSRILDENEKSLSIWKFLCYVEQNRSMFSTQAFQKRIKNSEDREYSLRTHIPIRFHDILEHRNILYGLQKEIETIKKWRDKKLAHIDIKSHIKNEKITLKRDQIENIIDTLGSILNKYSIAYNQTGWLIKFVGENDFESVLDAIRFRIVENKKLLEAMKMGKNVVNDEHF